MTFADIDIEHDVSGRRFVARIDGHVAYLSYAALGERTLDYRSTFVPKELRGRGLASALVEHALQYAEREGFKVVPSCPFVARTIDRKPTFKALVVQ